MELSTDIQHLKGIGPKRAASLRKLGIQTVYDLLTDYPRGYEDQSALTRIGELTAGESATILGTILSVSERHAGRKNMLILTAIVNDGSGTLHVTWFNQAHLKKQLQPGKKLFATGKVAYAYGGRGQYAMSQPIGFQILENESDAANCLGMQPIYASTESLPQTFFRKLLNELLREALPIPEPLPQIIRQKYGLMERKAALSHIHFPKNPHELQQARNRLAFEELYLIQCGLMLLKQQSREQGKGVRHAANGPLVQKIYNGLSFRLTHDQERSWREICADMEQEMPMRRLLQGDVGSGKTVLALLALAKTVENGHQGAMMAPTEILARQHAESFSAILEGSGIRLGFLSGHLTKKQKEEMHEKIAAHALDLIIGTHALIQESVQFAKLGLVVTDEQHRFGIAQRAKLEKQGYCSPDVLVMTATPIPRTMTLTVYGDLDVSLIQELPPGREPVRTFIRQPDRRDLIYAFVRKEILQGRQAYVVCPMIEANEEMQLPSAEEVYIELNQGIFQGIPCGIVHGRMAAKEKEETMRAFHRNEIKLLVATTVIEVGINVPNASIMVIENADRFGLAQLHQLRGRIGRGGYRSYCILVSHARTESAKERLRIMETTANGFQLAEEDLRLRGPGQFFGNMQHGLPDLKIANVLQDMAILRKARQAAIETMNDEATRKNILPILAMQYQNQFPKITEA